MQLTLEPVEYANPTSASNQDLLTTLIGCSRTAERLLTRFGTLREIRRADPYQLAELEGMNLPDATRLLAALESGARMVREERPALCTVRQADDVYQRMKLTLRDLRHEEFHVLLLNTQNQITRDFLVTRGTLDASLAHPREVFRQAIIEAAASIVVVHNHPGGDPTPSPEDREVTRSLYSAGEIIGIKVLDHVIIGAEGYISFATEGITPFD